MRHPILRWTLVLGVLVTFVTIAAAQKSNSNKPDTNRPSVRKGIDVEAVFNPQKGQFRAILIGVNDYERLNDLRFCEEDVKGLRDQLIQMGFDSKSIKCLTTSDSDPAYRPTYRNITERLDALFRGLNEDSVLVIALSGHGGSFEFCKPVGKESKASFFCPQDARISDPLGTMISVKSIYDRLDKCPARFKMLLVDACRDPHIILPGARTAIDESKSMAGFAKSLHDGHLPKGTLALVSCASGEQSYEDPKLKHGIFMHYLLEGLAGNADATYRGDKNGIVSYRELKDYVYRKTSDHAWQIYDQPQTPEFRANWELPNFDLVKITKVVESKPAVVTRQLFDGKTLTGWKADRNASTWSVRDDAIVGRGDHSHLYFDESFTNFQLQANVKINRQGNGGLYFRASQTSDHPNGYELQIAGNGSPEGPSYYTGSIYRIADVKKSFIQDDTWFLLELSAVENHITIRIDGKKVLDFVDREKRYSSGKLALQAWAPGTVIAVKNIVIKKLPESTK